VFGGFRHYEAVLGSTDLARFIEGTRFKEKGNTLHSQGQTLEAIEAYGDAIENATPAVKNTPLMIQLYGNRAACYIVLEVQTPALTPPLIPISSTLTLTPTLIAGMGVGRR